MDPIITPTGHVLAAPRPARLADEVHPGLWLGGSWRSHTQRFDAIYDRRSHVDGPTLPSDLDQVAQQVLADIRADRKVLVRCHLGLNRSGLVAAVVLWRLTPGMSGADVLERLQVVRSPDVLCNPAFAEYVESLR